jgi:hypothetical protein
MIPLADLKLALRIDEDDTSQDVYIEELEEAAVAYVQRAGGRYIGPPVADAPLVFVGSGSREAYLPEYASAVSVVGTRDYPGGEVAEIPSEGANGWSLRFEPGATHGLRLIRHGGVWGRDEEYVATSAIGYGVGGEPADVRKAVGFLVAHWFELRIPVALGTVAPEVALTVADILKFWRRLA